MVSIQDSFLVHFLWIFCSAPGRMKPEVAMAEKILVVDDDTQFRGMLVEALMAKGFDVSWCGSAEESVALVRSNDFDIVLHDVKLPGISGIEAIPLLKKADPLADIIIMTAHDSKNSGVEALKIGAYDYFSKPFSLSEMEVVIRRALEKRRLKAQVAVLKRTLGKEGPSGRIIGDSRAMRRVIKLVERVASIDTTVLISGETGTGKELISDTIHALSPRADKPFVKLNCAAIPENLLESELFGHEKGAFTGATSAKHGKFELAEGGTILLDEIGDMPLHLQPKLLRAVEQKQVERLGGSKPVSFDVRIVAATNQLLVDLVEEKTFRGDLYYRLNIAGIHIPPLRERKEDIPLLTEKFIKDINIKIGTQVEGVTLGAAKLMHEYDWPGNVRQLANALERASIFCAGSRLDVDEIDLALQRSPRQPETEQPPAQSAPNFSKSLKAQLQEHERMLIETALKQCQGVQTQTAKLLGISPKNLWNKLQKHNLKD